MSFECIFCNYSTDDISNFGRHKKSNKHMTNEQLYKMTSNQTISKCDFCHKEFSSKSNMDRHKKNNCKFAKFNCAKDIYNCSKNSKDINNYPNDICEESDSDDVDSLSDEQLIINANTKSSHSDLKTYIMEMKNNQIKMEKEMEKLKEQNDKLLNLATENSKTANTSVRGITYAMKHFRNAQQLKLLKNDEAVKLLTYDNKSKNEVVEMIIIKYKNGLLDKYLGDILIKSYKKDDSTLQSLWGVDTTRMHFILKQKEWTSDNCGVKLTELVIDPFLKSVNNMILKYCVTERPNKEDDENNVEEYDEKRAKSAFDIFTKKWEICQEIVIDLSKKKIHKQILKYITPHLKLTQHEIKKKSKNNISESE